MSNPWLDIPLAEYEGHMSLPTIDQADMLAAQFENPAQRAYSWFCSSSWVCGWKWL